MGHSVATPINEAVGLLARLDPQGLVALGAEFPSIAEELRPGRIGGEPRNESSTAVDSSLDFERAEVAARALIAVANMASIELETIRARMKVARRLRLATQVLTVVCSSGVLGAFAFSQTNTAIAIAVLTLLSSVGTLVAEHGEKLLLPGKGDIYQAYEQANSFGFRARKTAEELRLFIRYKSSADIKPLIIEANQLSEQLHDWVTRMVGSR